VPGPLGHLGGIDAAAVPFGRWYCEPGRFRPYQAGSRKSDP
jgi:hypothetical protein